MQDGFSQGVKWTSFVKSVLAKDIFGETFLLYKSVPLCDILLVYDDGLMEDCLFSFANAMKISVLYQASSVWISKTVHFVHLWWALIIDNCFFYPFGSLYSTFMSYQSISALERVNGLGCYKSITKDACSVFDAIFLLGLTGEHSKHSAVLCQRWSAAHPHPCGLPAAYGRHAG